MCFHLTLALTLTLALILPLSATTPSFQTQCLSFAPPVLPNTTLRLQEHIPPNTTLPLHGTDPTCARPTQFLSIETCRIALTLHTSPRSSVIVDIFLPHPSAWRGRTLTTDTDGIDGCIKYEDMAYGVTHGFASVGTNVGHNGTSGVSFLNNEDVVVDFAWRGVRSAAAAGRAVTEAFYGRSVAGRRYYIGCSGGGRQGIQVASMFPDEFDGVVVGAPALNFNAMAAWRARFYTITGAVGSEGFITEEMWKGRIHSEVLKQCDAIDGVVDGVLTDASLCAGVFRPEALLCTHRVTESCLSAKQVEIVREVFSPLYGVGGTMLYPGLAPGAESLATQRLLSGTPFPYSVDWFRYAVYSDPSWDPASFTIADAQAAQDKNPGNAATWPSDLSPFRDAGGKLLVYHGGADQQITGFNTEKWYNYLSRGMRARSEDLDEFVRFFRVPGMGHCSGGVGAWQIGQNGGATQGIDFEGRYNVLAAMVDWVENGVAPETIVGTRFVNDSVAKGVELRRTHCRYPLRSTYVGGDASSMESWDCK
ncbi:tannase and feruloyl esterase [Bimuria novae-zelandiae CBS 107.79]|uniref:Carboxylic ester hydrolase n=1 Tax=Bimuria novae-zelandiae CBS 107.79 TaxID=1447943 RepID=A0A6A5VI81_9PLEO|nr:tannase and feruloyl esterase [Bimuria novae-zelandiae CBS 107.79]